MKRIYFISCLLLLNKVTFSQNVGIGTTNPATRLHVSGTSANIATFNGGSGMWMTLAENTVNRGYIGSFSGNDEDVDFGTYSSNITGKVHLTTGNQPRLSVNPLGNIGIGTPYPEGRLHLRTDNWIKTIFENDAGQTRGYIGSDNNGTLTLSSNAYWNGSTWVYPNSGNSLSLLLHQPNEAIEFRVRPDAGSQSTAMVVKVNGNVGIGTTSPQQKLEVNGAIKIGNSVTNTAGSVRFNNNKFEGHDGFGWNSFDKLPAGSLVTSPTAVNAALTNSGYNFVGSIPGVKTRKAENITVPANSWLGAGTLVYSMSAAIFHTAVWTGSDMLLWGGGDSYNIAGGSPYTRTYDFGCSYNPSLNLWDTISTVNAPSDRFEHTAVWTGNDMIIWGGRSSNNDGSFTALSNGGILKYPANAWTAVSAGPTARYKHTAVWTGNEMIIWGGQSNTTTALNSGSSFNLTSWSNTTTTNAPTARISHTAVWTGTEMIIWGGSNALQSAFYNTGARYNPATNTWTTMTTTGAPASRTNHTAIWTGTEMIIWGGFDGTYLNSGAKYNPTTNTWTSITVSPLAGRERHTAIWTGTEMICWGGNNVGSQNNGMRYNLAGNNWSSISNSLNPLNEATSDATAIWTGQQVIYFGGRSIDPGSTITNLCQRYFPSTQNITNYIEKQKQIFLFEKQ